MNLLPVRPMRTSSSRYVELKGRKFGRLTVKSAAGMDKHRMMRWRCVCECGKEVVTRSLSLRTGHTVSCGCIKFLHGMGATKTYYSWVEMKRRCLNPQNYLYPKYGGRGIRISKRWLKFINFLKDMGVRPEGKSLDRINGKKGYSPRNCR